jgi:hypothetical protein
VGQACVCLGRWFVLWKAHALRVCNHASRGDLDAAQSFVDELLEMARQQGSSDFLLQAHHAAWTTRFHLADQVACRHHTAQGRALYEIEAHASHRFVYGGHDPGVCALNTARWRLGFSAIQIKRCVSPARQ